MHACVCDLRLAMETSGTAGSGALPLPVPAAPAVAAPSLTDPPRPPPLFPSIPAATVSAAYLPTDSALHSHASASSSSSSSSSNSIIAPRPRMHPVCVYFPDGSCTAPPSIYCTACYTTLCLAHDLLAHAAHCDSSFASTLPSSSPSVGQLDHHRVPWGHAAAVQSARRFHRLVMSTRAEQRVSEPAPHSWAPSTRAEQVGLRLQSWKALEEERSSESIQRAHAITVLIALSSSSGGQSLLTPEQLRHLEAERDLELCTAHEVYRVAQLKMTASERRKREREASVDTLAAAAAVAASGAAAASSSAAAAPPALRLPPRKRVKIAVNTAADDGGNDSYCLALVSPTAMDTASSSASSSSSSSLPAPAASPAAPVFLPVPTRPRVCGSLLKSLTAFELSHLGRFIPPSSSSSSSAPSNLHRATLLYDARRDGFNPGALWPRIEQRPNPTLLLVRAKSSGNIFGAVVGTSWPGGSVGSFAADARGDTCLFSLRNEHGRPVRLKPLDPSKALYRRAGAGPGFGSGGGGTFMDLKLMHLNREANEDDSSGAGGVGCAACALGYDIDQEAETKVGLPRITAEEFKYTKTLLAGAAAVVGGDHRYILFAAEQIECYELPPLT